MPTTKSGRVLCHTLQKFECLSIRLCSSPLMSTYWVGYLLSTCSLFRIGVHRTTHLILTYCWVFCLLLSRNLLWEKPNKNITVRTSVCPSVSRWLVIRVRSITLIPCEIISQNLTQIQSMTRQRAEINNGHSTYIFCGLIPFVIFSIEIMSAL